MTIKIGIKRYFKLNVNNCYLPYFTDAAVMNRKSLYVYLSSKNHPEPSLHIRNQPGSFNVKLETPLVINSNWKAKLVFCNIDSKERLFICSNIVAESFVGNSKLQFLSLSNQKDCQYIDVKQGIYSSITVFFINEHLSIEHLSDEEHTDLCLHLKQC